MSLQNLVENKTENYYMKQQFWEDNADGIYCIVVGITVGEMTTR